MRSWYLPLSICGGLLLIALAWTFSGFFIRMPAQGPITQQIEIALAEKKQSMPELFPAGASEAEMRKKLEGESFECRHGMPDGRTVKQPYLWCVRWTSFHPICKLGLSVTLRLDEAGRVALNNIRHTDSGCP
jgi:hypothetical protein